MDIEEQYRQEKREIEPLRPAFRAQLRQRMGEPPRQSRERVGVWATAVAVLAVVMMVGTFALSINQPSPLLRATETFSADLTDTFIAHEEVRDGIIRVEGSLDGDTAIFGDQLNLAGVDLHHQSLTHTTVDIATYWRWLEPPQPPFYLRIQLRHTTTAAIVAEIVEPFDANQQIGELFKRIYRLSFADEMWDDEYDVQLSLWESADLTQPVPITKSNGNSADLTTNSYIYPDIMLTFSVLPIGANDNSPENNLRRQELIEIARAIAQNSSEDFTFLGERADVTFAAKIYSGNAAGIMAAENPAFTVPTWPIESQPWIVSFAGQWEKDGVIYPHFVVAIDETTGEPYEVAAQTQISREEAIQIAIYHRSFDPSQRDEEPVLVSSEQTTYHDAWRRTHLHSPINLQPERDNEPVWLIHLTGEWTIGDETLSDATMFFNAETGGGINTQFHTAEEAEKLADGMLPDAEHVAALVNHFADRRLAQIDDGWLYVASDVYNPDAAADESQRRLYPDPTMRHEGWYDFDRQIGLFRILAADGNATQIVVYDGDQAYNLTFNDQHESQPVSLDMQLPAANARLYLEGAEGLHAQYNEDRSEVTVSLRWMEADRQFRYSAENGRLLEYKDSQQTITYLTAENVVAPPTDVLDQIDAILAEMRDAGFNPNGTHEERFEITIPVTGQPVLHARIGIDVEPFELTFPVSVDANTFTVPMR